METAPRRVRANERSRSSEFAQRCMGTGAGKSRAGLALPRADREATDPHRAGRATANHHGVRFDEPAHLRAGEAPTIPAIRPRDSAAELRRDRLGSETRRART